MKTVLSFLLLLALSASSFAQHLSGSLDSSFGVNGIVNDRFTGINKNNLLKVFAAANGKTLIVTDTNVSGKPQSGPIFRRYTDNGSIDNTYGISGTAIFSGLSGFTCMDAALQTDNKLIVVGYVVDTSYFSVCLRMNADGSVDSSFGHYGIELIPKGLNLNVIANGVAIQADGKIVVTTFVQVTASLGTTVAFRFNTDGSPDAGFGSGGQVLVSNNSQPTPAGLFIQQDGKICAYGNTIFSYMPFITRLNSNGSIDSSFGKAGTVLLDAGSIYAMVQRQDGKLIVGYIDHTTSLPSYYALLLLNRDGSTQPSWGVGGIVNAGVNVHSSIFLNLSASNQLIVATTTSNYLPSYPNSAYVLSRFNSDGNYDSSFGTNGMSIVPVSVSGSADDVAFGMAVDPYYESIVLGGVASGNYINLLKFRSVSSTGVTNIANRISEVSLFPNPATKLANLRFSINKQDIVSANIYNISGQLIKNITQQKTFAAGTYNIPVNLSELQPGVYFLRLQGSNGQKTMRLVKE